MDGALDVTKLLNLKTKISPRFLLTLLTNFDTIDTNITALLKFKYLKLSFETHPYITRIALVMRMKREDRS